jgi:hypothetical protein
MCIEDPSYDITVCLKDIPWNANTKLKNFKIHLPLNIPIQKHPDYIQSFYYKKEKKIILLDGVDNRVYRSTSKKGDS